MRDEAEEERGEEGERMQFSVRKILGVHQTVYRVCFRHSEKDPWTKVLGTDDYLSREEAERVLEAAHA